MKTCTAVLAAVAAVAAAQDVNYMADKLAVTVEWKDSTAPWPIPKSNLQLGADWGCFTNLTVTLEHQGSATIRGTNFEIFFHSIRRVLKVDDNRFEVSHVMGDLYKLTPTKHFKELRGGQKLVIPMVWEYWTLFSTDFMPRWYISGGGKTRVIKNTDAENDVSKYAKTLLEEVLKKNGDQNTYMTPKTRFDVNSDLLDVDHTTHIVPTPTEVVPGDGEVDLKVINLSGLSLLLKKEEIRALETRAKLLGLGTSTSRGYRLVAKRSKSLSTEEYRLNMEDGQAVVTASSGAGAFYAVQSLLQLVHVGKTKVPKVTVNDAPRFGYRAQHLDVARNFHSKAAVLRLIDAMAAFKMNRLLLHLADDEGWRLEIPDLPELTSIGGRRCHDPTETKCILPQLGSGPDANNNGSGSFSRNDFVEILKYARDRFVQVIPEFDMPGHARAATVAMEARFKKTKDTKYRLADPDDKTVLGTVQYYDRSSLMNPCQESTFAFVEKVLTETKKMYRDAGVPLTHWSLGGDEAKNAMRLAVQWGPENIPDDAKVWYIKNGMGPNPLPRLATEEPFTRSPKCQAFLKNNDIVVDGKKVEKAEHLMGYFAQRVSEIAHKHGVHHFSSWQDGYKHVTSDDLATPNNYFMDWDALFWGSTQADYIKKGYKAISSIADFTYFDFPYETNTNERGYYWASRSTPLRKVFSFAPVNLAQNAEVGLSRSGGRFELTSPVDLEANVVTDAVVGMQGQIWSETIRTPDQLEYMAFPRVLAIAERAWHQASWELEVAPGTKYSGTTGLVDKPALHNDYNVFVHAVAKRELAKLDKAGIKYRVPPAGAKIEGGKLQVNCELPGLHVEAQLDAGKWVPAQGLPVGAAKKVTVRVRSADGKRTGREEVVAP